MIKYYIIWKYKPATIKIMQNCFILGKTVSFPFFFPLISSVPQKVIYLKMGDIC